MAYYKLVASGRPDVTVDEIILKKSDDGEVELSVSVHQARELPDDAVESAKAAADRIGYSIEEAEAPEQGAEAGTQLAELQEVGTDIIGTAPLISDTDQESGVPVEQGSTDTAAEAGTADSGSPSSAATPSVSQSAPARTISS